MNGIYSDSVPQELVDSTIKRAARRWAIKRALIGLGSSAVCAVLLFTGWSLWGAPLPDTVSTRHAAASGKTAPSPSVTPAVITTAPEAIDPEIVRAIEALYGDLDRTSADDAVTYALLFERGLDLTDCVPFTRWSAVYEETRENLCRRMIMAASAALGMDTVKWTEDAFYYMEFVRPNRNEWSLSRMVPIAQFDPAALGLDEKWADTVLKCDLLTAAGEFLVLQDALNDTVRDAGTQLSLSLPLPFAAKPSPTAGPLDEAQRLYLDRLDPTSPVDEVTLALLEDRVTGLGEGRLVIAVYEEFGRETAGDEVTVYLWAHILEFRLLGDDVRTRESVSHPVRLTLKMNYFVGFMLPADQWIPEDGEGYADSIRENFGVWADKALAIEDTDIPAALAARALEQADALFHEIGLMPVDPNPGYHADYLLPPQQN
ncbi:MAG: hypothetical protein GX549_01985 [Clostridiales bacterium]|nr:hypothetical protein [Clostridiales bacterium]